MIITESHYHSALEFQCLGSKNRSRVFHRANHSLVLQSGCLYLSTFGKGHVISILCIYLSCTTLLTLLCRQSSTLFKKHPHMLFVNCHQVNSDFSWFQLDGRHWTKTWTKIMPTAIVSLCKSYPEGYQVRSLPKRFKVQSQHPIFYGLVHF